MQYTGMTHLPIETVADGAKLNLKVFLVCGGNKNDPSKFSVHKVLPEYEKVVVVKGPSPCVVSV